jgi:hypothetical protein
MLKNRRALFRNQNAQGIEFHALSRTAFFCRRQKKIQAELRLAAISSLEQANAFLVSPYLPQGFH